MRARISSIGTQLGEPLESVTVEDRGNFSEWVRAMIGPSPGQEEEIFDIYVCSTEWIKAECSRTGYFLARRLLVIPYWDPALVRRGIEDLVSSVTGETWQELAAKLCTFAHWEFEDYQDLGNASDPSLGSASKQ